jgi:hypothetical protein
MDVIRTDRRNHAVAQKDGAAVERIRAAFTSVMTVA